MGATTPAEDAPRDPLLGRILDGKYRVTGLIGAGGMGSVYRVEHVTIGKAMAVKVLHPRLGGTEGFVDRFEREGKVGGKISHPNCVAVSDFGRLDDGAFYLVMELLEGESLGDVLDREGRLHWRRALHVARHVLRGLGHAHERGVVHRDIKPDNIFLARTDDDPDVAKILDFGIAKLVGEGGATITQAGITIGTPAYLSPEQAFGSELDGRSDLYSLSIVLYEMLTGRTPFGDRDALAMLTAHAVAEPPPFAEVAPDAQIPAEVEALVRQGLAKSVDDRIPSAGDYVARIDGLLRASTQGWAIATPPPGTLSAMAAVSIPSGTHTVTLPPRRWSRLALAIGSGVVAIGAVAALASSGGGGGSAAKNAAPAAAKQPAAAPAPPPAKDEPKPTSPLPSSISLPSLTGPSDEARLKAAIHDLEKAKTCGERKAAVDQLRSLGDKRAIPALKKARYRMRGGVLGLGDKNTNACLKKAAEDAIKALGGS